VKLLEVAGLGANPPKSLRHARGAWRGEAYLQFLADGYLYIHCGDTIAPYGTSFDDVMADDWEIVLTPEATVTIKVRRPIIDFVRSLFFKA
jgi:hypothetical protein